MGKALGIDPVADLVQLLRARRLALGWSQAAVDERLGCADALVAKWESGARRPSPAMAWLWATTLGCELVVQFGPAPPPPEKHRHRIERRVRQGEGAGPIERACNAGGLARTGPTPYET